MVATLLGLVTPGCTENVRAKKWGGTMAKTLLAGQKVVTVTWKDGNLWVLTRPMHTNEVPETFTFKEDATLGILNGTVIIKEQ